MAWHENHTVAELSGSDDDDGGLGEIEFDITDETRLRDLFHWRCHTVLSMHEREDMVNNVITISKRVYKEKADAIRAATVILLHWDIEEVVGYSAEIQGN